MFDKFSFIIRSTSIIRSLPRLAVSSRHLHLTLGITLHCPKCYKRLADCSKYVLNNVIADPHPSYNEKVLGFGRISQVVLAVDGGSGPLDPPPARRLQLPEGEFHPGTSNAIVNTATKDHYKVQIQQQQRPFNGL